MYVRLGALESVIIISGDLCCMHLCLQMTVTVRDRATPTRSAQAFVTVIVNRDNFPPEFMDIPYFVSHSENKLVFTSIFTVTANDPDLRVKTSCYFIFLCQQYQRLNCWGEGWG